MNWSIVPFITKIKLLFVAENTIINIIILKDDTHCGGAVEKLSWLLNTIDEDFSITPQKWKLIRFI